MKSSGLWIVAHVLGLCLACGGSSGQSSVDAGPDVPDAYTGPDAMSQDITGTVIDRYVTSDSDQMAPRDVTQGFDIGAVSEYEDGKFSTHTGSGSQDGSFVIPNVRVGRVMLRVGKRYFDIEPGALNLGAVLGRRINAVRARGAVTIDAIISGLTPWAAGHSIELVAPWADGYLDLPPAFAPAEGSTRLSTMFDYTAAVENVLGEKPFLIDGSQLDTVYMTQLTPRTLPGTTSTYDAVARLYTADPFIMVDSQTTRLRDNFVAVTQTQSLTVDWQGSAFAGMVPSMLPPGSEPAITERDMLVYATPAPLASGATTLSRGTLVRVDLTMIDDASLTMDYGNPYPDTWEVAARMSMLTGRRYEGPGQTSVFVPAYYEAALPLADVQAAPLAPVLGPVRNPRMGGKDASVPQLGFPDAPELAWEVPELGTPHFYEADVFRLDGNARELVATIRTQETRVVIPAGVMLLSERYVLRIRAHWSPNDPVWGPDGSYHPYAVSSLLTELMRR